MAKKGRAKPKAKRCGQANVSKKPLHNDDEVPSLDDQPALRSSDDEVASLEDGPDIARLKMAPREKLAKKAAEYAHKAEKKTDLTRSKVAAISKAQRNVATNVKPAQRAERLAAKAQYLEDKYMRMTKEAELKLAKQAQEEDPEGTIGTEAQKLDKDITPHMWKDVRGKCQRLTAVFAGHVFALEIYAGCGYWSGAVAEAGLKATEPIEPAEGQRPWADTNNPWVRAVLLTMIELGLVWYVHLAPDCKLWGNARTTSSKDVPVGPVFLTIQVLQAVASFNLCSKSSEASRWQLDFVYMSMENPWPSRLFFVWQLRKILATLGAIVVKYDNCPFGADYKKRSKLRANMDSLAKLSKFCPHPPGTHDVLEGEVTIVQEGKIVSKWKTSLAARCVPGLCREWVEIMRSCAPPQAFTPPGQAAIHPYWQILLI